MILIKKRRFYEIDQNLINKVSNEYRKAIKTINKDKDNVLKRTPIDDFVRENSFLFKDNKHYIAYDDLDDFKELATKVQKYLDSGQEYKTALEEFWESTKTFFSGVYTVGKGLVKGQYYFTSKIFNFDYKPTREDKYDILLSARFLEIFGRSFLASIPFTPDEWDYI